MNSWKLTEAQRCLETVIHSAISCGPQRITGRDGDVVVVSAGEYGGAPCDADPLPYGEPASFLEMMQRSSLAEAIRAGDVDLERYPGWPRGV